MPVEGNYIYGKRGGERKEGGRKGEEGKEMGEVGSGRKEEKPF